MKILLSVLVIAIVGGSVLAWVAFEKHPAFEKEQLGPISSAPDSITKAPTNKGLELALPDVSTLGVGVFMRNSKRYQGTVHIEGIVSAVDADKKLLALIDISEFQACKTTECAKLTLPVHWESRMPEIGETVVIIGAIKQEKEKSVFHAEKIQVRKKRIQ